MYLRTSFGIILLLSALAFSQIQWQTTHNGSDRGLCALEVNKITITVHPYHINVEEEAVIGTRGSVWSGDDQSLEIFGTFRLTEGAALRSMLLWNGDEILKARLKDRAMADSSYEEVVDRDNPDPVIIDPALIEYLGNNRYEFKIYPVAIGRSRKLRILYTIPLQVTSENMAFTVKTAFAAAAQFNSELSQVPITIKHADSAFKTYYLEYGDARKIIRSELSNITYLIPYDDLGGTRNYHWKPIRLVPDRIWGDAYTYHCVSEKSPGYYTAIFSHVPDTVQQSFNEGPQKLVEALVRVDVKTYSGDFQTDSLFSAYIKSTAPWDSTIQWTAYDDRGDVALEYAQQIIPDTTGNEELSLIWASKYSLDRDQEPLG